VVPFLDEAAKRLFLRKVAGSYIFVHRLLLEHFVMQESGANYPDTAASLYRQAALYYAWGKYAKAEEFYLRTVRSYEQQSGPDHPDVAYPLTGLATFYKEQGEYAEAEELCLQALRIWEQQLGPNHSTTQSVWQAYTALLETMKQDEAPST
jgi:tetratricopeptide (TPR) repeat protein